MNKTAIITGACGFIGKKLTKCLLEDGYVVHALVINKQNMNDLKSDKLFVYEFFFENYDKISSILPKDVDLFYHLAWEGIYGDSQKNYELQLNNVKYSCLALEQAIKLNVRKFILASTVNVLETKKYFELDYFEPRYATIYSTAKLSAEMICKTIAYNSGIEFNTGMIAMVYGENSFAKVVPNVVISNLIYDRETNLIDGNTKYDLIYVDDVAKAFVAIGKLGKDMKTYYIGNTKIKTFSEIFDQIKAQINPKGIINYGVHPSNNNVDYDKTDLNALEKDTNFVIESDFSQTIEITRKWILESGAFK